MRSTKFPAIKVHDQTTVRWNLFHNDIGLWLESCPHPTHNMRVKTAFVNAKKEKVFSKEIATKNSDIQVNSRFNTKSDGFIRSVYSTTQDHFGRQKPGICCHVQASIEREVSGHCECPRYRAGCLQGTAPLHLHRPGAFTADGQISNWTVGRRRQISTGKIEESLQGPPCKEHL